MASAVADLFNAARVGDTKRVDLLLSSGIDPNASMTLDAGFRQPVFFPAALNGHMDTMEVFWKHGANLRTEEDSNGETVLATLGRMGKEQHAAELFRLSSRPESERAPSKDWTKLLQDAMSNQQVVSSHNQQGLAVPTVSEHHPSRAMSMVNELTGALAALHAERNQIADEIRNLHNRDAKLASEMQAIIAQLQLLPRVVS